MKPEQFPLAWPEGYPVTERRQESKFKCTLAEARDGVLYELRQLNATDIVISTNVQVTKQGLLPGNGRLVYDNPGVAVYFKYRNKEAVIACDNWKYLHENMRAVEKSLEAIRGLERWACTDIISQALGQHKALPPATGVIIAGFDAYKVLGIIPGLSKSMIKARYHELAKQLHPDKVTGDKEKFIELSKAFEIALREAKG